MPAFIIKLKSRREIAAGTTAFVFEKPVGFQFKAGQYLSVSLINPPETDAEGDHRSLSIASAPCEPDILLAMRMRDSAFKRVFMRMPLGTEMKVRGPFGSFVLPLEATRPIALLMGGIGITPARAIVVQAAHDHLPHRLFLFYANRRPEDTAFLEELQRLEEKNPRYTFVATMEEEGKSAPAWNGARGFVTRELLVKHLGDLAAPIYFVAGPPPMVMAMRKLLETENVPATQIRTEEFTGY